ncbi:hypothetical protein, partial [Streptomyces pratensis]|uniref:hypothetical protein n=1 Tax=Streptomyces pratensis TaxID=1169025 RepID=UPI00301695D8
MLLVLLAVVPGVFREAAQYLHDPLGTGASGLDRDLDSGSWTRVERLLPLRDARVGPRRHRGLAVR